MTLSNRFQNLIEKEKRLERLVLIFSSLFFSIVMVSRFFTGGAEFKYILLAIFIIMGINYVIVSFLFMRYKSFIDFLIFILSKKKLKHRNISIAFSWLPSSIVCGSFSILITLISGYYVQKDLNIFDITKDYFHIVDAIVSFTIYPLVVLFILLGLITHVAVLRKMEKVNIYIALCSSIVSIAVFALILWVTQRFTIGLWGMF